MYPDNDKFKLAQCFGGKTELKFRNTSLVIRVAFGADHIHAQYLTTRIRDEYVPETIVTTSPVFHPNNYTGQSRAISVATIMGVLHVMAHNYKRHRMRALHVSTLQTDVAIGKGPWRRFITLYFDRPGQLIINRKLFKVLRGEHTKVDEGTINLHLSAPAVAPPSTNPA